MSSFCDHINVLRKFKVKKSSNVNCFNSEILVVEPQENDQSLPTPEPGEVYILVK